MRETKQINIKDRTYYFDNDQIDLKDFDARLLKVDKKDYNKIDSFRWSFNKYEEVWEGIKKKLNMGKIFKKLDMSLMKIYN